MMTDPDRKARDQFLMEHLPLVRRTAARIHSRLPVVVDIEDLVQEGTLGLRRAMLAFKPSRKVKFTTFAPFYIRGAILDHLRGTDWVPRLVRQQARALEKASRQLRQELRRDPSEEELAEHLQLPPEDFARMKDGAHAVSQVSLSESRFTDEAGRPVTLADQHADPNAPDPLREAQRRELRDAVTRGLSRTERLVVLLYYYERLTMREIGRTLSLSESRVSQMHSEVVKGLKARLNGREHELDLQA